MSQVDPRYDPEVIGQIVDYLIALITHHKLLILISVVTGIMIGAALR